MHPKGAFSTDEDFRLNVLDKVSHPIARQYFARFNNLAPRTKDEWIESTLNKVNAFLSDDRIREMFSFKKSSFSLREIMDSRKILLLKLDRGGLKDSADLIGSLFMSKIKMAAFSRSDIPKEEYMALFNDCVFGRKFLLERGGEEAAEKADKKEEISVKKAPSATEEKKIKQEQKTRTLEEIIASMIPIEKAILYAIGTGNYYASDIFEMANKELKKMGSSTRHYSEFKKKFYEFSKKASRRKRPG